MPLIHRHQYDNGLTLLVEPMTGVSSVAMTLLTPGGVAAERADRNGAAAVLSEMLWRGAGDRDARQHSDALDRLGVHRSSSVATWHTRVGMTAMGDRIGDALPLIFDAVRRPRLDPATFEPSRQLALQSLAGLEDDPQQKVMVELRRAHHPDPIGRSSLGDADHLRSLAHGEVVEFYRARFRPGGSIVGIAGAVEFERVRDLIGALTADWTGSAEQPPLAPTPPRGYHHQTAASTQVHIGLAYDTIGEADGEAMTQRVAVAVLSGGMSGRLFTEVREKRGLCYTVYATYAAQRERGSVYAYSGTKPERAAETLDVLGGELRRLSDGVERAEYDRAIVGLKSRIVMQGESTGARAAAIAGDQFVLGAPRTLEQLAAEIDAVTLDRVNAFVADHRPAEFTTLTIGPASLMEVAG